MPDQVARPTVRPTVAVGKEVNLPRAMAMVPGHGVIVASQGKPRRGHSTRGLNGYHARVVRDSRRHSQEGHGHRDKEVHVSVPQPRATRVIGDPDGAPRQVIVVDNSQPSSSTPPDNDAGVRAPLISSPQRSSTHHHLVAVDVMSVDNRVVTPISMDQERCLPRHLRPWDALSVDREVAIPPATRQVLSNRFQVLQASQ